MDLGKLIGHLITLGLALSAVGLLIKATNAIKNEVIETQLHRIVPLGGLNRRLNRGY